MSITIYSIDQDLVIDAKYVSGKTTYEFGIQKLIPLINKLDIQRDLQDPKFYKRLEKDLLKGCIMPPITLAFLVEKDTISDENIPQYINENIGKAFVLDGIQRLNTLKRASENSGSDLAGSRPLFLNIIVCYSMDNLLYRMITLNNGQKPMTARHQIEILANNVYDFDSLSIKVRTEKERKRAVNGAFKKADIVKSYIAFLSNSTNIDNQKIIEQKMDELVADRILDSNITEDNIEFEDVMGLIARLSEEPKALAWFQVNNNLIGFTVGIKDSYSLFADTNIKEFSIATDNFEKAFSGFNISKFNVGQQRRKLASYFISHYANLKDLGENDMLQVLMDVE